MKKIYCTLLSVALLAGALTSCSDDFLDGVQDDRISDIQLEGNDEVARSFLMGAYQILFAPGWGTLQMSHDDFGLRALMLATDLMADDIATFNGGWFFEFDYANMFRLLNFRRPNSTWRQFYAIIRATNQTLEILRGVENPTDEQNRLMGEALALRGYSYFLLINMFQQPYSVNKNAPGIPIMNYNDVRPGRNTVAEVYEVILSDLFEAFDLLEGKGMISPVHLSEYAVAGMLARVLSFVNDHPNQWAEVARFAGIATQGSPLMTTQAQFSAGFNDIGLAETLWGSAITVETNTFFASFFSSTDPFRPGYAGLGYPFLIASYLYNRINPQDLRYAWFTDGTAEWIGRPYADGTPRMLPRYASIKFIENRALPQFSSDYIYMRSSEFFYVKAEALFLNGDEAGARAALETVMRTRLAGYSAAGFSGQALLDEIRIQKRIDTWGGGRRLFDMKWRGEALDRTGSTNHSLTHPRQLPPNPYQWVYQIPLVEMNSNPYITENNP